VATASLLEISDSLASTADNQANGSIGDHNLEAVLAFFEGGRGGRSSRVPRASVDGSLATAAHATVHDDPVNHLLGLFSLGTRSGDLARAVGLVGSGRGDKLNTASTLTLHAPKILALTADDETNKA